MPILFLILAYVPYWDLCSEYQCWIHLTGFICCETINLCCNWQKKNICCKLRKLKVGPQSILMFALQTTKKLSRQFLIRFFSNIFFLSTFNVHSMKKFVFKFVLIFWNILYSTYFDQYTTTLILWVRVINNIIRPSSHERFWHPIFRY